MKGILSVFLLAILSNSVSAQVDSSLVGVTTPFELFKPIYVVDGLILDRSDFLTLNLRKDEIKSANALNSLKAVKKYGLIGDNGIIEISTKLIIRVSNGAILTTQREKWSYLGKLDKANIPSINKIDICIDTIEASNKSKQRIIVVTLRN